MHIKDIDLIPDTEESTLIAHVFSKLELLGYAKKIHLSGTISRLRTKSRIAKTLLLCANSDVVSEMLDELQRKRDLPHPRRRTAPIVRHGRREPDSSVDDDTILPDPSVNRTEYSYSPERFLDIPSLDQVRAIYQKFYDATSDARVQMVTCAVCSRKRMRCEANIRVIDIRTIPNQRRLHPTFPHTAQKLTNGMLLSTAGISAEFSGQTMINICEECYDDLRVTSKNPPKYSLANNLWFGAQPWIIQTLTFAERLLISRIYHRRVPLQIVAKRWATA